MLFTPTQKKQKKYQKGRAFNKMLFLTLFAYGQIGLKFAASYRVTVLQLTAIFLYIRKRIKKRGALVISPHPQVHITKKPSENRMGKGKGHFCFWAARVNSGGVLCEISTFDLLYAYKVLVLLRFKLPFVTKFFFRLP